MENQFASSLFFTFETKTPKIVQEKWEAFPPGMENRCASNLFSLLKQKLQKLFKKNGQHFPLKWKINFPQTYFHF